MRDEAGNAPQSWESLPSKIHDASKKYLIMEMESGSIYLVHKKTNAAYDLTPIGAPTTLIGYNPLLIYTDANENMYYLRRGVLKKINVSDPKNITAINYTPDLYHIGEQLAVDSLGNVLFSYSKLHGSSGHVSDHVKLKIAQTNKLHTIKDQLNWAYTGHDGSIYYGSRTSEVGGHQRTEKKVTVNDKGQVTTDAYNIRSTNNNNFDGGGPMEQIYFPKMMIILGWRGTMIYVNKTDGSKPQAFAPVAALEWRKRKIRKNNATHIYVLGRDDTIKRIAVSDRSVETIIENDKYEFYLMDVDDVGTVYFNALDLSNSKKVVGTINSTTKKVGITSEVGDELTVLQRVN